MKRTLCIGLGVCLLILFGLASGCADPTKGRPAADVSDIPPAPEPGPSPTPQPTGDQAPTPAPQAQAPAELQSAPAGQEQAASPAPETPAAPPPAAVAAGPTRKFKFSYDSSVGFIGYNMIGGREGGFAKFDGSATANGDSIESLQVELTIDMKSVFSDAELLTKKLKGDKGLFEVDKYPTATFKSTAVTKSDTGYTVAGTLNLHGAEKAISFPANISLSGNELKTQAEFTLNRQDFGIVYQDTGDYFIKDDVVVKLDIIAKAEEAVSAGT